VQVQLELWPASDKSTGQAALWKRIDPEGRERLAAALARLIRKSVAVPTESLNEESGYE
jgi:hypothetical protein